MQVRMIYGLPTIVASIEDCSISAVSDAKLSSKFPGNCEQPSERRRFPTR